MNMPADAAILFSVVNMKLRDGGVRLRDMCLEEGWNEEEVISRLAEAGYKYDEGRNAFVAL